MIVALGFLLGVLVGLVAGMTAQFLIDLPRMTNPHD